MKLNLLSRYNKIERREVEMSQKHSKNDKRAKRIKRAMLMVLAKKLRDKSLVYYLDIIQIVKDAYRPPCRTGILLTVQKD